MKEIIDVTELKEASVKKNYLPKSKKISKQSTNKVTHKSNFITSETTKLPNTGHPSGNFGILGLGIMLVVLAGGIFVKSKK